MSDTKKRTINPYNKPGPKIENGMYKDKTMIFLSDIDFYNKLKQLSKDTKVSSAFIIRNAIEEKYPNVFKKVQK